MTQEEMKSALQEELKAFKENLPTYVSPEDLENKLASIEEKMKDLNVKEDLTELKQAVEAQGIEMRKFTEQKEKQKSIKEQLMAQKDILAKIANGEKERAVIKTDVTRSLLTDSTISMRLPDVGQIATQLNVLEPLFAQGSVGPNMGGVVRYVDQTSRTNNAAYKAEAAQYPESAIAWAEKTMSLQKLADSIPVTKEALNDIDFIESEIRNLLLVNHGIKKDNALWNANGTAPNIKGIYTYADTYTAAAAGISDASIYDLIVKVHEDISGDTKYMPNYAIMNIADINKMRLKKDANNNYVLPPFVSADGKNVAGMTIIASNSVTADTMLIGDFRYATLYTMGGVEIEVGYIDKQFIEDMVTLKASQRMGLLVRSVHEDAFRKVTGIAADLVTLAS